MITLVALLLGVLGMAGEYRHHTVTTTFLATPRRGRVVVAKLVAHALTGALMGLCTLAAAGLVAVPWLASSDVAVHVDGDARAGRGGHGHRARSLRRAGRVGGRTGPQPDHGHRRRAGLAARGGGHHRRRLPLAPPSSRWLPSAVGGDLTHAGGGKPDLAMPVAAAAFVAYVVAFGFVGVRLTTRRDIT